MCTSAGTIRQLLDLGWIDRHTRHVTAEINWCAAEIQP